MGWISSTFCLILHNTAEWGIRCIRPGNGVLACTVTQMKLCFFFHDTSLACSKKKTHYCSCGALFMKYLTSHSPNLCSNHSVFVWSIIWVHLGHVDSEGRNVAFIVFSLNNTFPSDQIQVNPTDWLMQLCFQVNLLLIKQVAQISERSKKKKKKHLKESESRADSMVDLTRLIDSDLPSALQCWTERRVRQNKPRGYFHTGNMSWIFLRALEL